MGTQSGEFRLIKFIFDQAMMDIAEVTFQKLELKDKCVVSSLDINGNFIFGTSFFQKTSLFQLKTIDILETD